MANVHDRLVDILRPAVTGIRPAAEMAQVRSLQAAVDGSGHIKPSALTTALPWLARDFHIAGTVATGANVTEQLRVRQASRIVYLDAIAKTAPSTGPLIVVVEGGATDENVSIAAGQTSGTSATSITVAAGSLLTLNVTAANGAADVTVTVWLVPDTEG